MTTGEKVLTGAVILMLFHYLYKRFINPDTIQEAVITSTGRSINNPGNIMINPGKPNDRYRGEVNPLPNSKYRSFSSMKYGYRAMYKILKSYRERGYQSIFRYINTYSGADNAEPYSRYVSNAVGLTPVDDMEIVFNNPALLNTFISAMARFEQGAKFYVKADDIKEGLNLA